MISKRNGYIFFGVVCVALIAVALLVVSGRFSSGVAEEESVAESLPMVPSPASSGMNPIAPSSGSSSKSFVPSESERQIRREAASAYLEAYNSWSWDTGIQAFAEKMSLLTPPSEGRDVGDLLLRPEIAAPSETCVERLCRYIPNVEFIRDEVERTGEWVGYFQVSVKAVSESGIEIPAETRSSMWMVTSAGEDPRPVSVMDLMSKSIPED